MPTRSIEAHGVQVILHFMTSWAESAHRLYRSGDEGHGTSFRVANCRDRSISRHQKRRESGGNASEAQN